MFKIKPSTVYLDFYCKVSTMAVESMELRLVCYAIGALGYMGIFQTIPHLILIRRNWIIIFMKKNCRIKYDLDSPTLSCGITA